jgi:hypothetical protein
MHIFQNVLVCITRLDFCFLSLISFASFDIGPIIMQKRIDVPNGFTTLMLLNYLAEIGAKLVKHFHID